VKGKFESLMGRWDKEIRLAFTVGIGYLVHMHFTILTAGTMYVHDCHTCSMAARPSLEHIWPDRN